VIAAEKGTRLLQAVSQDAGTAMMAGRRECMDRAFEAVERMRFAVHHDLKRFVVVVAASFASSHAVTLLWTDIQFARMSFGSGATSMISPDNALAQSPLTEFFQIAFWGRRLLTGASADSGTSLVF
jgi:hypothetical protein